MHLRYPAVADMFYPADAITLEHDINGYLTTVPTPVRPKALIAPHAGYVYSGSTAGVAYATLRSCAAEICRVLLLGPAHKVGFAGIAAHPASAFLTPLGQVQVPIETIEPLFQTGYVGYSAQAHQWEHSLEVQVPFLQAVLGEFELIPLLVGQVEFRQTAEIIDRLWGGPETLIIVSSDLSHYHDYQEAQRRDAETSTAIEGMSTGLVGEQACGCLAINGLLHTAGQRKLQVSTLARCNSGDTAGDREKVVGYGSYAIH